MSDHPRIKALNGPWLTASIVGICSIVFVAVLIDYEPTRNWLCPKAETRSLCVRSLFSEFQTLLTGLAALIAAVITVGTMQRTAEDDRKRHRQVLHLTLRPDFLKIERLIEPQLHELETCVVYFQRLQHGFDPYSYGSINTLWQVEAAAQRAIEICERECWTEAADLFSGPMTKKLADYKANLTDLISTSQNFRTKLRSKPAWAKTAAVDGIPQISHEASDILTGARTILGFAFQDGFKLMLHLRSLKEDYLDGELRQLASVTKAVTDTDA